MKRLVEDAASPDEVVARAARLLASEGELSPSEERRLRVRAAMRRREGAGARVELRGLVVLGVAALVLLVVAGASAGVWRWWQGRLGVERLPARADVKETALAPPSPTTTPVAPPTTQPLDTPSPAPAQAPAPLPASAKLSSSEHSKPVAASPSRHRAVREGADAKDPGPTSAPAVANPQADIPGLERASREEVELVFEATDRLLNAHDAAGAGQLLDTYLARFPRGAIHEYALHLAMRAAVERHTPEAQELARRYLVRYPRGTFRAQAERVARDAENAP